MLDINIYSGMIHLTLERALVVIVQGVKGSSDLPPHPAHKIKEHLSMKIRVVKNNIVKGRTIKCECGEKVLNIGKNMRLSIPYLTGECLKCGSVLIIESLYVGFIGEQEKETQSSGSMVTKFRDIS